MLGHLADVDDVDIDKHYYLATDFPLSSPGHFVSISMEIINVIRERDNKDIKEKERP